MSRQHRAAGHKDSGHIDARRRHQKPGYILVAVGHHHQSVKLMRQRHTFRRVGDQIPCHQGILHADMPHSNTVADCNSRKYNRHAAGFSHTQSHRVHNFIQIHMSGHNLVVGADDAHHRLLHLLLGKPKGIK